VTSVIDLWRAVDPQALRVSGSDDALGRPVRGVARTRAAPPHLPPGADGQLLVVDVGLVPGRSLGTLVATLEEAELRPAAIAIGGHDGAGLEPADESIPILASTRSPASLADAAERHLADEAGELAFLSGELRLAAAEAALADPRPAAPAGLVAARIRRGVAVSADGELRSLNARPAGTALAARFAAIHARLLAAPGARQGATRNADGLWLLEQPVRPNASVWLFDDLPFARADEVAAEALGITLRALLRRPAPPATARPREPATRRRADPPRAGDPEDRLDATLLAVARANGRVAVAARALGVHRNTVLYRLRIAAAERGVDPRRPEDALRILAEAQGGSL
jgi:hypothetical protein